MDRVFCAASAKLWNNSPNNIKSSRTLDILRVILKTFILRTLLILSYCNTRRSSIDEARAL